MIVQDCQLCSTLDQSIVYSNNIFRVVLVSDIYYPGFVRLIMNDHYKEMSDLPDCMVSDVFSALIKIEKAILRIFVPDKINLASLGNVVPHVHWHIIPRYINDRHYPNPIWGEVTNPSYLPESNLDTKILLLSKELELALRS